MFVKKFRFGLLLVVMVISTACAAGEILRPASVVTMAEPVHTETAQIRTPVEIPPPDEPVLGVASGPYYRGQTFVEHIHKLGIRLTLINIHQREVEPHPGERDYSLVDSFLDQLQVDTVAMIRLTTRPDKTVPDDISLGGNYYNFVHDVVARTNGRVMYFESEWEADFSGHWTGTPEQYAELSRTFYAAVKAANPDARIVMGGALGLLGESYQAFWDTVFTNLIEDEEPVSFDIFDMHLYGTMYDIPERVSWFRAELDRFAEFEGTPLWVTEYGGPVPQEFTSREESWYNDLLRELESDPCLMSTDLLSTPLHPEGYPDRLRMFATGIEPELTARRNRIQGRQMVKRTLLALSAGAEKLFWWNLFPGSGLTRTGCVSVHPVFGKMGLMTEIPGGVLMPNPTYVYYQTMAGYIEGAVAVDEVETGNPEMYVFEVMHADGSTLYVVWEQRDQFSGEDDAPVEFSLRVPWDVVRVEGLFGGIKTVSAADGVVIVEVDDTPVFILQGESPEG